MSESKDFAELSGTTPHHHHPQQTETSPLKQNDTNKNWLSKLFWSSPNENEQGSLKTIVLNFFVFTVIVTLGLLAQIYYKGFQIEPHGSVASDSKECSEIGTNILRKGGNAVDAIIATSLCLGVVNFHITGLGGGGYMMIYNHMKQEVVDILDFRVTVPNSLVDKPIDTSIDGLTVGVPGYIMGIWNAHQKYGKLHWQELVVPAVNLAKYGFLVSNSVISARTHLKNKTKGNRKLVEFLNSLKEGENVTLPELASTLELIQVYGPHAFYNGSIAMNIIYSVKKANGSMTLDDLSQYQSSHSELLHTRFGNYDILAPGSSGGALLLNALDSIQFLDLRPDDDVSSIVLKISDILHDTYVSYLEKNEASPFTSELAASQVSAVDNEELYVSFVSGLNTWLGSQILTEAGFILNNAITNGGVDSDRRPLTLSTTAIALETNEICGKRLILGSGDATIAAQVLTNALVLSKNVSQSIENPRFFISNVPRLIRVEDLHDPFFDADTFKKLRPLLRIDRIPLPYKSINIIEKNGDTVISHSDTRGGGLASQF